MAEEQQVERIKGGVEGWNQWREENPDEVIDLSEADLRGLKLAGINFKNANLKNTKLQFSNLAGALLDEADLERARLQEVNLQNAQLARANVSHCNLMEASLQNANFENSSLKGAQFNEDVLFAQTNLKGADLTDASGLNVMQIQTSLVDANTRLPDYLSDDMEDEDFLNSMI